MSRNENPSKVLESTSSLRCPLRPGTKSPIKQTYSFCLGTVSCNTRHRRLLIGFALKNTVAAASASTFVDKKISRLKAQLIEQWLRLASKYAMIKIINKAKLNNV